MSNIWPFTKQPPKYGYINNPNWRADPEHTNKHNPCGYWPAGAEMPTQPNVNYILWSCGRYAYEALGRDHADNNIFLPMDDPEHFYKASLGNGGGLYIKQDKSLWGLGINQGGQLGTGDKVSLDIVTQIGTDEDWEEVTRVGNLHTLAIKENGTLWAAGDNTHWQLGLGDDIERLTFTQVGTDNDWVKVHSISYSSYAIKEDGTLYSWGDGGNGNLGHGNNVSYSLPEQVTINGDGFDSLTGGYYSVIGLKSGKLWACGYNLYGQLCLDNTTATNVFVERSAGETWDNVHSGHMHTMLVRNDGTLHGVGLNVSGNLGLDHQNNISIVTQVGTDTDWWKVQANGTSAFSMALKIDGSLWSCGNNFYGQLGLNSFNPQGPIVFTEVGGTWGTVLCGDSHSHIGEVVYDW